jgi:hypothetical protein
MRSHRFICHFEAGHFFAEFGNIRADMSMHADITERPVLHSLLLLARSQALLKVQSMAA